MIAVVNLDSNVKEMEPATYERLRALIPGLPDDPKEMRWWDDVVVDIEQLCRIVCNFRVVKVLRDEGLMHLLEKVSRQLERTAGQFNERCNVHVPGFGLLAVSEVKICEDYCTDRIDDLLKEGWRIIAVCPQPDQRRPDYVLGRSADATHR